MSEGRLRPSPATEDAELGVRLRAGDPGALGDLHERHVPDLYDFLGRFVRDLPVAEDLARATFLRAWELRETLREPARVRAWLYAIGHSLALDHVDRSSLDPQQYAVLDLSVRRGFSAPEIAEVLDVPVGRAWVLIHRAREALGGAALAELPPLPLPASLGIMGKLGLLAEVAPRVPVGRPRGQKTAAAAVAALLLLVLVGGALSMFRPAGAGRRPAPPVAAAPAPAATPTPEPIETARPPRPTLVPAPAPAPLPAALRLATALTPALTPRPQPPPFAVASVTVRSADQDACRAQGLLDPDYLCSFVVTVQVVNASGNEVVTGTVTGTSAASGESRTASFQAAVAATGASAVSVRVALPFARCPQGTASAATRPAAGASLPAGFGDCDLLRTLTGAAVARQPATASSRATARAAA